MNDAPRKQRTPMMTGVQCQDLMETAAVTGMRVPAFIVHRLGTASVKADDIRIGDTLARMERPLACLDAIERLRLSGDPETWTAIDERGETRLVLERRLDW